MRDVAMALRHVPLGDFNIMEAINIITRPVMQAFIIQLREGNPFTVTTN